MEQLILSLVDAVVDGIGNAFGWILIGVMAFILDVYRRVQSNAEQIKELEKYLTGDENDPSQPGLLSEVADTRADIREVREKMDGYHRSTNRKLDRLLDTAGVDNFEDSDSDSDD